MSPEPNPPQEPRDDEWGDEWGVPEEQVEEVAEEAWGEEPVEAVESPQVAEDEWSEPEPAYDEWGDEDSGLLPARRHVQRKSDVHFINREEEEPQEVEEEESAVVTQLQVREITGKGTRPRLDDVNEEAPERVPKKEVSQDSIKLASRDTEDRDWGKAQGLDWKWVIGSGLAVIFMVVLGLVMLPRLNKRDMIATDDDIRRIAEEEYVEERKSLLEDLLLMQDKAEQIYLDYASAPIVDELLPLLRDRKRVEPLVRASHQGATISKTWDPGENFEWRVVSTEQKPFGILTGLLQNFDEFTAYFVIEGEDLYLDWEATVGYGTATFAELKQGFGDPSKIRGVIQPALFYTDTYPEADYQCFQMISPDDEDTLWVYVQRNTELERMIANLFVGGDIVRKELRPHKLTVALERGPEGSAPNQWLIRGVWHTDWVSP